MIYEEYLSDMDDPGDKDIAAASAITDYEFRYAEMCYRMEESDAQSLSSAATNVLASASIVSVAFVGIVDLVHQARSLEDLALQILIFCIALFLIASLAFVLIALLCKKHTVISTVETGETTKQTDDGLVYQFERRGVLPVGIQSIWRVTELATDSYYVHFQSLHDMNERTRVLLQSSLVALVLSVLGIALFLVRLLCLLP